MWIYVFVEERGTGIGLHLFTTWLTCGAATYIDSSAEIVNCYNIRTKYHHQGINSRGLRSFDDRYNNNNIDNNKVIYKHPVVVVVIVK